jgi:hypothetical protein
MNLPPQPSEADLEGRLTRGIAAIQREVGFSAHLNYREPEETKQNAQSRQDGFVRELRMHMAIG